MLTTAVHLQKHVNCSLTAMGILGLTDSTSSFRATGPLLRGRNPVGRGSSSGGNSSSAGCAASPIQRSSLFAQSGVVRVCTE